MKKTLSALLLSVLMLFTMCTTAFAATGDIPTISTGTEEKDATVSITKNFIVAEGITVPNVIFTYEIKSNTPDAPKASCKEIYYSDADTKTGGQENGVNVYEIKKTSPIVFEEFKHAGVYEYTVNEVSTLSGNNGILTDSNDVYTLRVYVANKAKGGVFVQTITAEKNGVKQAELAFNSTYTSESSLVIEKQTKGTFADKTKDFDFTIKFTKPSTSDATEFVGSIDGTEIHFPLDQEVEFKLHDGQKLEFKKLPAGTRYVVTEQAAEDGYTPSVTVTENGVQLTEKKAADNEALSSIDKNTAGNLVGGNENKAVFVNNYKDVPITGIIVNNLPFIILIGAAGIAFVTLVVLKRRRAVNR